jgi:hypothetical protein
MRGDTGYRENEQLKKDLQDVKKRKRMKYGKGGFSDWLYLMITHVLPCGCPKKELPRNAPYGWIYALFDDEQLVYIGKALDLRSRLARHHVYDNSIHDVLFYYVGERFLTDAENSAINTFRPCLNYNGKLQSYYKNWYSTNG